MTQRKRRKSLSCDEQDDTYEKALLEEDSYEPDDLIDEPFPGYGNDFSDGRATDGFEEPLLESLHDELDEKNGKGSPEELGATESFEASTSSGEDPAGAAQPKMSDDAEPTGQDAAGHSPPKSLSDAKEELQSALASGEYALVLQALNVLADMAYQGSSEAAHIVTATLDENPHIWQPLGDLGSRAETVLIEVIYSKSPLGVEATKRHIAAMRDKLLPPAATELERMAVQRVIMAWLMTQVTDMGSAAHFEDDHSSAWFKRLELSEKCYGLALKSLKLTRELTKDTKARVATAAQSAKRKAKPAKPK